MCTISVPIISALVLEQPFFLPVALHVVLAAIREWKRYKLESKKYNAWKAKKT